MTLQDYKIEGDYIKIGRDELLKWRKHYHDVAKEQNNIFYYGKRDVMIDLLKHFEETLVEETCKHYKKGQCKLFQSTACLGVCGTYVKLEEEK